jgi:hypothetical protein
MRPDKYIPIEEEVTLTKKLGDELLAAGFNASNSVIVTVSTDYSAHVGMWLRHHLSHNAEICDGFGIDVPYPDEIWNKKYFDEMYEMFKLHAPTFQSKSLIFVEAGVIRGGNYTYIIDWVRKRLEYNKKLITVTLYENQHSAFKSDFVGEYYDDTIEDLTFWWEKENKHWKRN